MCVKQMFESMHFIVTATVNHIRYVLQQPIHAALLKLIFSATIK